MANPVVHFEIIGPDPDRLRDFYASLFGWEAPAGAPVAEAISDPESYSFIDTVSGGESGTPGSTPGSTPGGIPGGIGGGPSRAPRATFYVGVPGVEAALAAAERLGGRRVLGPVRNEGGGVVVGHFTDPAGNLIGIAGPA